MNYKGPVEMDAGGLLTRQRYGRRELPLIRRGRYAIALPKGHLEDDDTLEWAAEREVGKETGITVRAVEFAGAMAYEKDGPTKHVVYFWAEQVNSAALPEVETDTKKKK